MTLQGCSQTPCSLLAASEVEWVDVRFDYCGLVLCHRLADYGFHFRRLVYRVPPSPAALREFCKIYWRELDAVFGVTKERHLLPSNHPKCVVLDYHHLDWQVVLTIRRKFGH